LQKSVAFPEHLQYYQYKEVTNLETTALRLRFALDARGMKQSELSKVTGIGKSSISTYLSGDYMPKQKNIYLMAQALNVDEAWLMGADVPMERSNKIASSPQSAPVPPIESQIAKEYGNKTLEDFRLYLQLDAEDRGEVRGTMKQLLKSEKYSQEDPGK
jgi:transcriptional regulator with XRE-family HTH domain